MQKHRFFSSRNRARPARNVAFDISSIDIAEAYANLLPDLRQTHDVWAWACCPFHDDNNPSFSVNTRSGAYRCMSSNCGARGGSLVGFVSALHGCDIREAIKFLEEQHG